MKLKVINQNYCATVVQIDKIVPLENCDNIVRAIVSNYGVVVSKDTKVGDIGLFFPVECELSDEFLSNNNLYRDKEKNKNKEKSGYFDKNRLRCVKFRGHSSEGIFMSLESLDYISPDLKNELEVGNEFDMINDIEICKKYIIRNRDDGSKIAFGKSGKKAKKGLQIVDNQFRLHYDTAKLKTNISKINPSDYISITSKWHGSSWVAAKVLCKRKLNIKEKIAKFFGVNVNDEQYKLVCSSRKVIKDPNKEDSGFYKYDIWSEIGKQLEPNLLAGMTMYGEVYGYLPSNAPIQKGYDYGCLPGTYKYFVYRITMTNTSGQVIEMPYQQMCEYLDKVGIDKPIEIFYGKMSDYVMSNYDILPDVLREYGIDNISDDVIREEFLNILESKYQNKMCEYNQNKVPAEGVVIRKDRLSESEAYKFKNTAFLEWETKLLDKGEIDIESEQSEEDGE